MTPERSRDHLAVKIARRLAQGHTIAGNPVPYTAYLQEAWGIINAVLESGR